MSNGNVSGPITGLLPLLVGVSILDITIKQVAKIGEDVEFDTQKVNNKKRR